MTRVPIRFTEAGRAQLDDIMSVMSDSFDPVFGEAWTAPQCAGLMGMPGVWVTLASQGDAPVGFALSRTVAGEAELMLLAVKRGDQGKGIGHQLLDHFVEQAAARGARTLHLEVREGNPAVKLYNSCGFSEIGRRRNYYTGCDGEVYDAITLSKKLGE
jgi:[ribosomal protein S18]-alanine N-acetyltransferase